MLGAKQGANRFVRPTRAIPKPQWGCLVSRERADERPRLRYPSAQRPVRRPAEPHGTRGVPERRERTGTASSAALGRNARGGATVCRPDLKASAVPPTDRQRHPCVSPGTKPQIAELTAVSSLPV